MVLIVTMRWTWTLHSKAWAQAQAQAQGQGRGWAPGRAVPYKYLSHILSDLFLLWYGILYVSLI
jgi:hypothetical protein